MEDYVSTSGTEGLAPITGELRGAATPSATSNRLCTFTIDEFNRLCDAIDAVHSQLEHDCEMWRDRAEDMRMERDDALREHHDFAPESHYMLLPKDADGEPIHVGDKVNWLDPCGSGRWHENAPVMAVGENGCYVDGWYVLCINVRHHRADTWERIIEDALVDASCATCPSDHEWTDAIERAVERCKMLAKEDR